MRVSRTTGRTTSRSNQSPVLQYAVAMKDGKICTREAYSRGGNIASRSIKQTMIDYYIALVGVLDHLIELLCSARRMKSGMIGRLQGSSLPTSVLTFLTC